MATRIIVVSPPAHRLQVRPDEGTIVSSPSPGDDYSHVIIEAEGESKPPPPPPPPPMIGGEPPPPLPIIMSLVGGLPPGVTEDQLAQASQLAGPLTIRDLAAQLVRLPGVVDLLLVLIR